MWFAAFPYIVLTKMVTILISIPLSIIACNREPNYSLQMTVLIWSYILFALEGLKMYLHCKEKTLIDYFVDLSNIIDLGGIACNIIYYTTEIVNHG